MPRGVPKNGFRNTKKRQAMEAAFSGPLDIITQETDEEIETRLNDRFEVLEDMTNGAVNGHIKALICSGPAGLGKSYTVNEALENIPDNKYTIIRGVVNKTGLYKTLYQYRHPGNVVVFDDADRIFFDEDSMNLLKAACDTMRTRILSYLSEFKLVDEDSAEVIPNQFEFEGTVIFITNQDFDRMIEADHKHSPHMEALVSRSHYIDMGMKTRRDYMIRIKQVVAQGMLKDNGLDDLQSKLVMDFIEKHQNELRELSLRIAIKIGVLVKTSRNWEKQARVTCCKGA